MPIPGQQVLQRILAAEAQARKIEGDARQAARGAAEEVEKLVAGQNESLRELAEHYLPNLTDDAGAPAWAEMRATVQQALLRKEDARRTLQKKLDNAAQQRGDAEQRWHAACDRVNAMTAACDELARQLQQRMQDDPEFQALSRRAAEGQARLEQAEASLREVEEDAREKLPNYEDSALFQYLLRRKFGTEGYAHRGATRQWDRWVAKLVDFPKAVRGYHFLTTAPERMRQLIAEQRTAVDSTIAEIENRQAAVASTLGLPRAQAEGAQARTEQDEAALALDRARQSEADLKQQVDNLETDQCPFYHDALNSFHSLLQRTERSLIAARAAATPELIDDQLVARIKQIDETLERTRSQLLERSRSAELAGQRAASFSELASRFRSAQYDHPRSLFDDEFDAEGQLWSILDGTTDVDRVWQHMRRYHRLAPTASGQVVEVLQHPMTQIMLQTMAHAAGSALANYAARAGQRGRGRRYKDRDWF